MKLHYVEMKSPVGKLRLVANDEALVAVLWEQEREGRVPLAPFDRSSSSAVLDEAEKQLREYFEGHRTTFDLPLDPTGTEFQRRVWLALRNIPYGRTQTYAELAHAIGNPKSCRAVGNANGRNPLSIIVPCHRVIGSDGTLTGFAGGLEIKEKLLDLERRKVSR